MLTWVRVQVPKRNHVSSRHHHDIVHTLLWCHCETIHHHDNIIINTLLSLWNQDNVIHAITHVPQHGYEIIMRWLKNMCNFNHVHVLTRVMFFRNSDCHWGREGREVMIAKGMQAKYPDSCIILHSHRRTYSWVSSASGWTAFSSF